MALRTLLLAVLTLVLGWVPSLLRAEEIVAVFDMSFVRKTDRIAAEMCFGAKDDDCAPWAHHYLYKARVRKVLSGTLAAKSVMVIYGRHALRTMNFYGVIARLRPLEPNDPDGAQFQVLEWGSERQFYCFDDRPDDNAPLQVRTDQKEMLRCYDRK